MIKKALSLLNNNDFLIITHRKPDGDTTGSASALCQILRSVNKTAYILENPDITPKYEHLIKAFIAPANFKPKFIITTDIASTDLLTDNAKIYADCIDLCIDHHFLSNNGFARENIILDTAACGEIVFEIAKLFNVNLNTDIATAIYTSISTDTGCFKYSNTTSNTHLIASECIKHINVGHINRIMFDMKTRERIAIEQRVLNNIQFYFDNKVAAITISQQDMMQTGACQDDLDSISALPRTIEGVEISFSLTELVNGDIKVSARSSGTYSVSDICGEFGGGGHLRAAGCSFKNHTFEQVLNKVLDETKKVCGYV